jgi:tetratricopeptide (TPR) repeat protein
MAATKKLSIALLCWFAVTAACCVPAWAEEYVAFSLGVARQRIERAGEGWREKEPEIVSLAGINKVEGFVYDTAGGDLILVGEHEEGRAPLTLDDLVVALRARFRYNQWPLVSIDPTPDTKKTEMQHVRFEGGIDETAFGQALYEADYRLKEMGMGLKLPGIVGLKTYWDRSVEEAESETLVGRREVNSRFWFYPINPYVVVREGVCVVRGLKVGVFTEVMGVKIDGKAVEDLEAFKVEKADAFASDVSTRFEDLCKTQLPFNRLRGLQELVAVSKALEEMSYGYTGGEKPDLAWWLEKYPLAKVETPKETSVLRRKYERQRGWFEVSGGVHLTALAMRLNAGDVKALREAVLKMRPVPESLKWEFVAGEWLVSVEPGQVKPEDVALLFQQAVFLHQQGRYKDAVALYDHVLTIAPDLEVAYQARALCHYYSRDYDRAVQDYDRAITLDPDRPHVYNNRGVARYRKGDREGAIADFTKAIGTNPTESAAYNNRGVTRFDLLGTETNQEAFAREVAMRILPDLDEAIRILPNCAALYSNRGVVYLSLWERLGGIIRFDGNEVPTGNGWFGLALRDFRQAIALDPLFHAAYANRAAAYWTAGLDELAIADMHVAEAVRGNMPDSGVSQLLPKDDWSHRRHLACLVVW